MGKEEEEGEGGGGFQGQGCVRKVVVVQDKEENHCALNRDLH